MSPGCDALLAGDFCHSILRRSIAETSRPDRQDLVVFLPLTGSFFPLVHSFVRPAPRAFFRPDRHLSGRRAQGLSRLDASSRPPEGLGLDRPEHGGTLEWLRLPAGLVLVATGAHRPSLLGGFAGARAAETVAGEIDAVGVMHDAIEDGVSVGRIADQAVPFVDGNLAGDDR